MNKDKIQGTAKNVAGKVQESAGKMVGSKSQQAKGTVKQVDGQSQKAEGDIKDAVRKH